MARHAIGAMHCCARMFLDHRATIIANKIFGSLCHRAWEILRNPIQGVKRITRPQGSSRIGGEFTRDSQQHTMSFFHALDLQEHRTSIGRNRSRGNFKRSFIDLRTTVVDGRHKAPLARGIRRSIPTDSCRQRLRKCQHETISARRSREQIEHRSIIPR